MKIRETFSTENDVTIYLGDCIDLLKSIPNNYCNLIITSPPYCMRKAYENVNDDTNTFIEQQTMIFDDIYRILSVGGSLCWQVGYHVAESEVIPLDYYIYKIFEEGSKKYDIPLVLRNRIIWTFGHGLNATQRFSGRHETILWFTKGNDYNFNLDEIRVPQKYPGKKHYRGDNKGKLSGNPLGKNPSDVWDIPNVKANHVEKTDHPCQFPVTIPRRLIKALTQPGDVVLDPFMGAGSSGVAAILEKRRFIGAEIKQEYFDIAKKRLEQTIEGTIKIREDIPIKEPNLNSSVATLPDSFKKARVEKEEKSEKINENEKS